jgi:(S)-ureidoglycine aminohydrolase
MHLAVAIVHVNPAIGAGFSQYTAEMEAGGNLGPTAAQRFVYVIDGAIEVGEVNLSQGGFCYFPSTDEPSLRAIDKSRVAVIEKPYVPIASVNRPLFFAGEESDVAPVPLGGDPALLVRSLVPDTVAYDFAVNTMTYEPGASLSMVEIHVMEHGLLMLEGGGIYRLNDRWYPVTVGDFIWMAPFCPQWFGALGKAPAKYLIFKDWNRQPL